MLGCGDVGTPSLLGVRGVCGVKGRGRGEGRFTSDKSNSLRNILSSSLFLSLPPPFSSSFETTSHQLKIQTLSANSNSPSIFPTSEHFGEQLVSAPLPHLPILPKTELWIGGKGEEALLAGNSLESTLLCRAPLASSVRD
ncbi:hypothetical protein BLNAU_12782 [Blattamonas nauphoetae]|uniref:Uncharacterized protein n=1 Tax=Blattamonas nauphoetae TaxID=2049346 RepID=A0ABQ9XIH6_9EUKA|nr:hypothetical protein BLNAU_12782 [Blattamonas nauphoetae]